MKRISLILSGLDLNHGCGILARISSARRGVGSEALPSHQAATKLIWLALYHITANWKQPRAAWQATKAQLAIQWGARFTMND